jgi:hypothetical protein
VAGAVVVKFGQIMATVAVAVSAEAMVFVVFVAAAGTAAAWKPAPGPPAAADAPSVAQLCMLALVIELLLATEPPETATAASAQRYLAGTKLGASLIVSALVAEELFVLAAMDVLLFGQVTHQACPYYQCSH